MIQPRFGFVAVLSILVALSGWFYSSNGVARAVDGPVAASQGLFPQSGPDLAVVELVVDPPEPAVGEMVDIAVVVRNVGNATVGETFAIHFYVEPADDPPTPSTAAIHVFTWGLGLAPNGDFDYAITNREITRDDWVICAWVDRDNAIEEQDTENNLLCVRADSEPPDDLKDAYEDDNTCADASEITTDGVPQERNLYRANDTDDVDWIRFVGVSGVRYTVEVTPVGADASPSLGIFNSCDTPPSFGGAKAVFTAPADGDYFLKIENSAPNYGPDNAYTVKVTADEKCSALFEPNDLCMLPTELSVGGGPQTHNFCTEDDEDWMRFEVRAGGLYRIEAANVGTLADVQLSAYTSCQEPTPVAEGRVITYTATTPGFVYLYAANADPKVSGTGTEYTVEITGSGGCDQDRVEPDNSLATAQPLNVGGNPQKHNICPAGDEDWVRMTASAGLTYTVETINLTPGTDTILCLYDVGGAQLRCDDDGGPGLGSRLTIEDAAAEAYYFRIRHTDPEAAGNHVTYELQAITGLCKPDSFEPDDSMESARTITADGSLHQHNICPAGDEDWTVFNATAGTSYVISTTTLGPDADTEIELYDPAGNLLARNDDHSPGVNSLLVYTAAVSGPHYIKTHHFNPETYGSGAEYGLSVRTGSVDQTPPPPPPPPPSGPGPQEAEAPPTGVRTLILVNRARIAELYSIAAADTLMTRLELLAQHPQARGEIIRLDNNSNVSAAYAVWTADITNIEKANQLTAEIRRVIMTYLQERSGVEYVVLVGDDRALPFRRVADHTTRQSESTYTEVDEAHPTGSAIRGNYYLTDDYFVDREPTPHRDRELYIPDLAIGRLIEAPADMIGVIDVFLANPVTTVEHALVTGYDFVQDTAHAECKDWKAALGDESKAICLISNSWTRSQFQGLQFQTSPPFKVQSINGHAAHYGQGAPSGSDTLAEEVLATGIDLSGGLIYTLGCHGGLNVPAINSVHPLDLPEAFVRKRANYVGNTGYGWGLLNSIGLSEKVIRLFTRELHRGEQVAMGKALATTKRLYYEQAQSFSVFDEKVMQQFIFYGLPMFQIRTQASQALGDTFPGVGFDFDPSGTLSGDEVITKTVNIDFSRILDPDDDVGHLGSFSTESGQYLALFDSTYTQVGEPVQPLHFGRINAPNTQVRSALFLGGVISTTIEDFDPLIGTPVNEYVPRGSADEITLDAIDSWYPPVPTSVRTHRDNAYLVTQLGQFNAESNALRLLSGVDVEIYYSTSSDQTPPEIVVVDALYDPVARLVHVKVGALDESGVKEVIVSYIEDERAATTNIRSIRLTFDAAAQKWRGSFPGDAHATYFVQVVDNAGNVATASNKGRYYRPSEARAASSSGVVYLPLVSR